MSEKNLASEKIPGGLKNSLEYEKKISEVKNYLGSKIFSKKISLWNLEKSLASLKTFWLV